MDRESKLRKLNAFRCRLPHVSHTALSSLLTAARQGDLPELCRRSDIREARDANVMQTTPYGPLIYSVDFAAFPNGTITVDLVNPIAMLYVASKTKYFSMLLQTTHAKKPCSLEQPWKLCLYADEAKPGAQMKQDNKRVLQNIYWSFLDFGASALAKEDFWFVAGTIVSADVTQMCSKMSQVVAQVVKSFFNKDAHNLRYGVNVELSCGPLLKVYGKFACMLADESGLHGIWYIKGSSGIKCCVECTNIVNKNWEGAEFLTPADRLKLWNKVVHVDKLHRPTYESIRAIIRELELAKPLLTNGEFNRKEIMLGYKYDPHCILVDPDTAEIVDPCEHNTYDWAHNLCQGIWQLTLWLVLEAFGVFNIRFSMLHEYLQQWTWPQRLGAKTSAGKDLFSPKRSKSHKDAKLIKAQVSEVLSVHLVIAHWIRVVVFERGICPNECKAYLTLSNLIAMLWHCDKLRITHEAISEATTQFLEAFIAAFGDEDMTWKFHAILHHALYVWRYGFSPHTITMERKHKMVLGLAKDMHNTQAIRNVLKEVVNKHISMLEHGDHLDISIGLIRPTVPKRKLLSWLNDALGHVDHKTSASARVSEHDICHKSDIVAIKQDSHNWFPALVLFFGLSSDVLYAAVSPLSLQGKHATYSTWIDGGEPIMVYLHEIMESLVYSTSGETTIVLHPLALHGI
jgi:hypothetical protein